MKYSYAIIDDDAAFSILLNNKLHKLPDLCHLASFKDSISGVSGIKTLQPDILFLDINIDSFDGFEVLDALDKKPVTIIVSTEAKAYKDNFPLEVCDYLQKPIRKEKRLEEVINKAKLIVDESRKVS